MFSKTMSCGIRGVEGYQVAIETDISSGLPSFTMVGYLAEEVREAQERVRTALRNSGFVLPPRRITVNLSPAGIRKEGTAFDLAIAASVLCCLDEAKAKAAKNAVFFGELGLSGEVKPVNGIISRVYCARQTGFARCFVPSQNVREGTVVEGIEIVGVSSLKELSGLLEKPEDIRGQWFEPGIFERLSREKREGRTASLKGREETLPAAREENGEENGERTELPPGTLPEIRVLQNEGKAREPGGGEDFTGSLDYADISGQVTVKRAMEIAAAGNHSCLLIGPAGTGKTMAAKRLPTILPPITLEESIEVSKVYSICGLLSEESPLILERPFRAPHHSVTAQSLAGGGRNPRPGELSLATGGVLFLDELTEFPARILDLMRQPLEEKRITVTRLNGSLEFPADFMLVCAMNPCRCGHYPDRERCTCTEAQIRRYLGRVSGPFLDRIDLGVEVPPVSYGDLRGRNAAAGKEAGESSASMRKRVERARKMQEERFRGLAIRFNSGMGPAETEKFCGLEPEEEKFLKAVYRNYGFSARGLGKVLKVARTAADLDGQERIGRVHLSEAVSYRSFEKRYWGFRK